MTYSSARLSNLWDTPKKADILYFYIHTCCHKKQRVGSHRRGLPNEGIKLWNQGNNLIEIILKVTVNSSVIRQKGESRNGCSKKTNHAKFCEKRTFLTAWNVRFSENLACFVFKHLLWDSPFCLVTNELCFLKLSILLIFWKNRSDGCYFG